MTGEVKFSEGITLLAPERFRKSMQCSVGDKVRNASVKNEMERDAPHPSPPDPLALRPGGPHHSQSQELPLEHPLSECQELAAQRVHGTSPPTCVPHTALT